MNKIGIFAGSFDPIHSGHISFALVSIKVANLDKIVFLPERSPRLKSGVEHFAHRHAMISQAIKPHKKLEVIDLPDRYFSTTKTVAELSKLYPDSEFFYLVGSDSVKAMATTKWTEKATKQYFKSGKLIVGLRSSDTDQDIKDVLSSLPAKPSELIIIPSPKSNISSSDIREGLRQNKKISGLLPSVYRYSKNQWLYVSLSKG